MRDNCSILRIGPNYNESIALHLQTAIVNHFKGVIIEQCDDEENETTSPVGSTKNDRSKITISNKYFSANILLEETCQQQPKGTNTEDLSRSEDGIILVFDDNDNNIVSGMSVSFDSLQSIHDQSEANSMAGDLLRLCVGVHYGNQRKYPTEKEQQDEYSRRIVWCLDHGYEYVEADLSTEGIMSGHDLREKDGFPRIIEAISGTVWTSADMITSKVSELKVSYETDKNITTVSDSEDKLTSNNDTTLEDPSKVTDGKVIDDDDDAASTNHKMRITSGYLDDDDNEKHIDKEILHQREIDMKEERQVELVEGAIHEARQIRELSVSGTLSDAERRKRAADAATVLLSLMGLDGDDDDDDDDCEKDDKDI